MKPEAPTLGPRRLVAAASLLCRVHERPDLLAPLATCPGDPDRPRFSPEVIALAELEAECLALVDPETETEGEFIFDDLADGLDGLAGELADDLDDLDALRELPRLTLALAAALPPGRAEARARAVIAAAVDLARNHGETFAAVWSWRPEPPPDPVRTLPPRLTPEQAAELHAALERVGALDDLADDDEHPAGELAPAPREVTP
ncbi:MAG: hypothetical protein RBU45_09545 [Myxococcota bacterium]|jgi:hypothetical protein|nr:hypothetical protein [Myxococcota bacterium]